MVTVRRHDAHARHYLRAMGIDAWHLKSVSQALAATAIPVWSGYVAKDQKTERLLLWVIDESPVTLSPEVKTLLTRMSAAMHSALFLEDRVALSQVVASPDYVGVIVFGTSLSPDARLGEVLSIDGMPPVMVTDAIETLLQQPKSKALVWKHLQQVMTWFKQ